MLQLFFIHMFRVSHLTTLKRTKSFPGFVNESGTKRFRYTYEWPFIMPTFAFTFHPHPYSERSRMIVAHFLYISSSLVAGWFYCTLFVLYTVYCAFMFVFKTGILKKRRLDISSLCYVGVIGNRTQFIANGWYFYWIQLTRKIFRFVTTKTPFPLVFTNARMHMRG